MEKEVWYQSKTVWASLIAMLIGVMQSLNIGSAGPVTIDSMAAESETIVEGLTQIGVFIAGAIALWGRLTATKKVTLKKEQ